MAKQNDTAEAGERSEAAPFKSKTANKLYRWASLAIGVVAVILVVLITIGNIMESHALPACDSQRAKDTLSNVFKSNNIDLSQYNEIKTISSTDDEVKCSASLAATAGGTLELDYRFFWDKDQAKYEVTRWQPPS